MMLNVTVADGKYTVQQDDAGRLTALRYGDPWRDCVGDGLICSLAYAVEEEREKGLKLIEVLNRVANDLAAFYVDWERQSNEPGYKADYPTSVNDAWKLLKEVSSIKQTLSPVTKAGGN